MPFSFFQLLTYFQGLVVAKKLVLFLFLLERGGGGERKWCEMGISFSGAVQPNAVYRCF